MLISLLFQCGSKLASLHDSSCVLSQAYFRINDFALVSLLTFEHAECNVWPIKEYLIILSAKKCVVVHVYLF